MHFKSVLFFFIICLLIGLSLPDLFAIQESNGQHEMKMSLDSLRNRIDALRAEVDRQKERLDVPLALDEIDRVENRLNELVQEAQKQGFRIDVNQMNLELNWIQVEIGNLEKEIGRLGGKFEKKSKVNWIMVIVLVAIIVAFVAITYYLFLKYRDRKPYKKLEYKYEKKEVHKTFSDMDSDKDFELNLTKKITLKRFETHNLGFYENIKWNFQPKVNVLLGKNGYGKSHLLRAVIALLQADKGISSEFFFNSKRDAFTKLWVLRDDEVRLKITDRSLQNLKKEKIPDEILTRLESLKNMDFREEEQFLEHLNSAIGNESLSPYKSLILRHADNILRLIHRSRDKFKENIGIVPVLAIPDSRFINKSRTKVSFVEDDKSSLKEYGAYHYLYQKPYEAIIQTFLFELCIIYLDHKKTFDLAIFKMIEKVIQELTDRSFKFHNIEPLGNARFRMEVITEGNEDHPLPIQNSSQGTLSVLAIFGLIYDYLKIVFPDTPEKEIMNNPAIIFIDEIDAHLHPSWQQKIVNLLRNNFPNVQFIVTAHSPLLVAGCKEREVSILRKGEEGFFVEQFQQDFIGYEAKELYQTVFDIEEKDENYLQYTALEPFREEMENEISSLERKKKGKHLVDNERKRLDILYDDLYYLEKTLEKKEERNKYANLMIENSKLRAEVQRYKSKSIKR